MLRNALIIEVLEAKSAVAGWRTQLDPWAPLGVPSHVTVLFPFLTPDDLAPRGGQPHCVTYIEQSGPFS